MPFKKVEKLKKLIELKEKDTVTVVGSHGKTSFCLNLCEELHKEIKKTVFTTTTKIFPVDKKYGFYNFINNFNLEESEKLSKLEDFQDFEKFKKNFDKKNNGVYILGVYDGKIKKIKSLPLETLEKILCLWDYIIIEADGSRGKPLKGWNETEPVYLKHTVKSVGIIPVNMIGKIIDDENIHRMDKFLEIAKGKKKEKISVDHLYNVITHKSGLFQHSENEKILLLNCAETDKDKENALKVIKKIKGDREFQNIKIGIVSLQNKEYYKYEGTNETEKTEEK